MPIFTDLEIALRRRDACVYGFELRLSPPDSDADEPFPKRNPATATLSPVLMRQLELDPPSYGAALVQVLFLNSEIQEGLARARSVAQATGATLRVHLLSA